VARRRLLSPTRILRRKALYKGFLGGGRGWMAVGAALWGPRLVKKAFGRSEQIVATEVLKPGQGVHLNTIKPLTRRQRRAG
jgi:hypothetical protein